MWPSKLEIIVSQILFETFIDFSCWSIDFFVKCHAQLCAKVLEIFHLIMFWYTPAWGILFHAFFQFVTTTTMEQFCHAYWDLNCHPIAIQQSFSTIWNTKRKSNFVKICHRKIKPKKSTKKCFFKDQNHILLIKHIILAFLYSMSSEISLKLWFVCVS